MAKASKRKTETSRRIRKQKPAADTASSFDVASIVRAAGLEAKHSRVIDEFLVDLQDGYRRELDLLDWRVSDKQIDEGLTQVRKHADGMIKATQNEAIRDALQSAFVLTSDLPSADQSEVEAFLKERFDADFDAIDRIGNLARKALKQHDRNSKEFPDAAKLPSASKPELQYVAAQIVSFWKREFGRGGSGKAAPNLQKFAVEVFEQITGKERDENTIRVLIRKARQ